MLILQHIQYIHPDKNLLFDNIQLNVNHHDKIALIGNNGSGKSTLLKIIATELPPSGGLVRSHSEPYYVPQIYGQYNHWSIARALKVEDKLIALTEILDGNVTEQNLNVLNDDWTIEERCYEALAKWNLQDLDLNQPMEMLSGGQKTAVFLAGISIHQPSFILLDEPSNHLDSGARELLYDFIKTTSSTLMVVSHDRNLLNLLESVYELDKRGITIYGGNYDFYIAQKQLENNALNQDLQRKEKALRNAKEKARETIERQQKSDARGKKKQEKAGVARIMLNTMRNNAENSTSKITSTHTEKIGAITNELHELRNAVPEIDKMKFGFDNSTLHNGKLLFRASEINFGYNGQFIWSENLNFQINSGERITLKGLNGSGKTTLINLILGKFEPLKGSIYRAQHQSVYIDQDYSLIDNRLQVQEQAELFNTSALQEHELKIRLNRFLFTKDDWQKSCETLSGGEKMRLMLCCLTIGNKSPDIIVLDEPTNNLDIQNSEILTAAINEYQGTLIVVSHDGYFLNRINIERTIQL